MARKLRKCMRQRPYAMDEAARRWMFKKARREYWRVAEWYDYADLIQDGFICYALTRTRYRQSTEPPHVMRLFQTIFTNHIHMLANERTKNAVEDRTVDPLAYEQALGSVPCTDSEMLQLVCEAPEPVRTLLARVLEYPTLLARGHRRVDGRRESTNSWLCRIAGLDAESNPELHDQLLAHLRA